MKTFRQFKAQLNEAKSKDPFNVGETIEDLSAPDYGIYPEAASAAKDATFDAAYTGSTFPTSKGPVPVLKALARQRSKATIDVKKGDTIIVIDGGDGDFADTVIGFDMYGFWKMPLSAFERKVGIK